MGIETIATSGMQAAMSNMEVISNNIANANTYGFKKSFANFSDLYPSISGGTSTQSGLGVTLTSIQHDFSAGQTTPTGQVLDMAIGNNSFFMLTDPNSGITTYTRNGRFGIDNNGYLVGGTGATRLQGFQAVNGTIVGPSTSDLQIPTAPLPAKASANVTGQVILDSSATAPTTPFSNADDTSYNYTTNSTVYDSLGNKSSLVLYYVKSATNNTWVVNAEVNGVAAGTSTLTFTQGGALSSPTSPISLSYSPTTGATSPQTLSVNIAGSTQYGGSGKDNKTTKVFASDGYTAGTLSGYSVDNNGILTATYSNQQTLAVGQVALAQFQSPDGLADAGNTSWTATTESGSPIVNMGNSTRNITTQAVELSNVDLTQEMVNLIGAQHTFQANAQVEQTYNEVIQTIVKL
jgi:flagellar hook protein FlgE